MTLKDGLFRGEPLYVREENFTYDKYAEIPEDGYRYEVLNGVLELMSPGSNFSHQTVASEMVFALKQTCNSDYLILAAPLDVILSPTNVLQPDLVMLHRSRTELVSRRGIEGPPDLVVEVLSPSSRRRDKITKNTIYASHGVPEYWIVDIGSRTLERYLLSDGGAYRLADLFAEDELVGSDRLPCVSFKTGDLFADVLPADERS